MADLLAVAECLGKAADKLVGGNSSPYEVACFVCEHVSEMDKGPAVSRLLVRTLNQVASKGPDDLYSQLHTALEMLGRLGSLKHKGVDVDLSSGERTQFALKLWEIEASLRKRVNARQKEAKKLWRLRKLAKGNAAAGFQVSLVPDDAKILSVLAEKHPVTMSMYDLAVAVEISRAKVGQRLKYLRSIGLAVQPHGERKGHTATDAGLRAIRAHVQT
jgi:biotin operon repressor